MPHSCFLVRTALLDPTRKVVAHEVAWQRAGKASNDALLPLLASALHDEDKGWLLADGHLVVPLAPSTLPALLDTALPPGSITIAIDAGAFDGADGAALVEDLRRRGYGLALRDADALSLNPALFAHATQLQLDGATPA